MYLYGLTSLFCLTGIGMLGVILLTVSNAQLDVMFLFVFVFEALLKALALHDLLTVGSSGRSKTLSEVLFLTYLSGSVSIGKDPSSSYPRL